MSNLDVFVEGLLSGLTKTASSPYRVPGPISAATRPGMLSSGGAMHRWFNGYKTAPEHVGASGGSPGFSVAKSHAGKVGITTSGPSAFPIAAKGEYGGATVHGGMNVSSEHQKTINARPEANLRARRTGFVNDSRQARAWGRRAAVGAGIVGGGLLVRKMMKKDDDE
jgi:hypothetical protein